MVHVTLNLNQSDFGLSYFGIPFGIPVDVPPGLTFVSVTILEEEDVCNV